ncbi:MAG TPA: RimK family alpha-L-glutamate ligase [Methanotrichaceae archaeon]|nr:RimK family alpha-L-glutamate ligase [Methanotrichaceae archaeon]
MRFGIVVSDPDDWTARSLQADLNKCGLDASFLNFSKLSAQVGGAVAISCGKSDLAGLEGLIVRDLGQGTSQDMAFRFEVLRALQQLGLQVINPPEAIATAANKFATSIAMQRSGVPTPWTLATSSLDDALAALERHGRLVSKPLYGYKGRGIQLITKENAGALKAIIDGQGMAYLQEFVELSNPRDIRAFVVGDELAGAIYRVAPEGSWISNLARGGSPQECRMTDELADLAVRASRSVGAVYCGVDLLETEDGLKVIEVNGTPSGKGIFDALGIDVCRKIANYVLCTCRA